MLKAFTVPKPLKILLSALLITSILFVVLMFFAIDDTPLLKIHHGFNREDIQRAKQLLHIAPEDRDKLRTLSLNQNDVNIATSYLLNHFVENTVQIQIGSGRMFIQIAVFVPESLWGRYLDFSFKLIQGDDGIKIKSLKIGEISIPDPTANYLIRTIVQTTSLKKYWQLAEQYVKQVYITHDALQITYLGGMVDAAKQLVIQKHRDYPNLHLYQQQINEIVAKHDPAWRLSLTELMQPLFLSAHQRSTDDTAIQENRAVIIAVASYIYKHDLRRYLPLGLIYSKEYQVFAYKRIDIPQHFIASALLASVEVKLLAEQMAEDKELGDAEKGSGFSFIDLTADRAGMRFGQMAIASPEKARALQSFMSMAKEYTTIIPDIQGLPEHLDEQQFKNQFGAIGSPAYQDIIETIDQRIADLPLYRQP